MPGPAPHQCPVGAGRWGGGLPVMRIAQLCAAGRGQEVWPTINASAPGQGRAHPAVSNYLKAKILTSPVW